MRRPLRVSSLVPIAVLTAALLSQNGGVSAYDVCTDDYAGKGVLSCAHEKMFDEAMKFYTQLAPSNRFSHEIIANAAVIREGVGAPDAGDPIYDNVGAFG